MKSTYIQLRWLEDTWAFPCSFSLQLNGYHVRLKLYVLKLWPWQWLTIPNETLMWQTSQSDLPMLCSVQMDDWVSSKQIITNNQEPSVSHQKPTHTRNRCYVQDTTKQALISRKNHSILLYSETYIVTAPNRATHRCTRLHLKPCKPATSCSKRVSTQTTTTPHVQVNNKQVFVQTEKGQRHSSRDITVPIQMDL